MDDISKIENEILNEFKDNNDIKVFIDYDIDACKHQILVEKGRYYSRIYCDINKMLNDGLDFEEITKIIINYIYKIQLAINEKIGE